MFSQVSICLFYVCSCFVSINPSAAVSLSKFRKINLDAKKDGQETSCKFSLLLPVNFSKLQRFKLKNNKLL